MSEVRPAAPRGSTAARPAPVPPPPRLLGAVDPVKRAFLGLAVALALGFLPAAYYARAVNGATVRALRAEQAQLSPLPASPEILARFDALDADVNAARARGVGWTLAIWLAVAAAAGKLWSKLVPSKLSP